MIDTIIRPPFAPRFGKLDLERGIVLTGTAEQMFFFNAPLAHIVAYEAWHQQERLRQTHRRQARMARRAGLAPPPLPLGDLP